MDFWERELRALLARPIALPDLDLAVALSLPATEGYGAGPRGGRFDPPDTSEDAVRLRALVELATEGDAEAFGQLYDHYVTTIYRYVYYRVGSVPLAEDITGETFVRALRSIHSFSWEGKNFSAWLTTIARNLVTDHYRSRRAKLELVTDAVPDRATTTAGPEEILLAGVTHEALMNAVNALPEDQRNCILMRFVNEMSVATTAEALGKSEGAVKQLQLRAVRNLARSVTKDRS